MNKKMIALLLSAGMILTALSGCKGKEEGKETAASQEQIETGSQETVAPGSEGEDPTQESITPIEWNLTAADYSYGMDDYGFIKGVKALDYVKLPDFKEIVFDKAELTASEEELDSAMDEVAAELAEQITDRAVEKDDLVNIDYAGYMDEVAFDGGTATDQDVVAGGSNFIDDFLTQIIGHKPGETMDVNVTFPDPYQNNPDFAGKDAVFVVTINYIHGETPELTDQWIKDNPEKVEEYFGVTNVESVQQIRDSLAEDYYTYTLYNKINDYLYNDIVVDEVPDKAIEWAEYMENVSLYSNYGMTVEQFTQMGVYTEETVHQMTVDDAETGLFIQALAEQENWKIEEADLSELTGEEDNTEYLEKFGKGYLCRLLFQNRVINYFKDHVTIK